MKRKIIANLNLVCWEDPDGGLDMQYIPEFKDNIDPKHKKACQEVFKIIRNSFEFNMTYGTLLENRLEDLKDKKKWLN